MLSFLTDLCYFHSSCFFPFVVIGLKAWLVFQFLHTIFYVISNPYLLFLVFWISFVPDILSSQTRPIRPRAPLPFPDPLIYPSNYIEPVTIPGQALVMIEGWQKIQLGDEYTNTANILEKEYPWMLPTEELFPDIMEDPFQANIEMYPNDSFKKFHLQFNEKGVLYLIRMIFSEERFDYLSVYKKLQEKYGPPQELNFKRASWIHRQRKIIFERNNTLKYLDTKGLPSTNKSISSIIERLEKRAYDQVIDGL